MQGLGETGGGLDADRWDGGGGAAVTQTGNYAGGRAGLRGGHILDVSGREQTPAGFAN